MEINMPKALEPYKVNPLLQNSKTLHNVSTRMHKHLLEVFPCTVGVKKVGELFYIIAYDNDKALYSYCVENDLFRAFVGEPDERNFLLDNDPKKTRSQKTMRSHKWMFEHLVQHWYDHVHEKQTA